MVNSSFWARDAFPFFQAYVFPIFLHEFFTLLLLFPISLALFTPEIFVEQLLHAKHRAPCPGEYVYAVRIKVLRSVVRAKVGIF